MKKFLAIAVVTLCLPGCAVVGIGLAAIAADNIANGPNSYTNQGLDALCEKSVDQERRPDGTCPKKPEL